MIACLRHPIVVLAVMACSACQRPPAPDSEAAGPAAAPAPASAAAITEAESSLAIKRGRVTLTADARIVRFCGETTDVWLVAQDDATLDDTYARLAGEPGTPLYVEMRGERVVPTPGTSVPATFSQAFLIEELLYAGTPDVTAACPEAQPPYLLLARGNEPFWSVQVMADTLLLTRPGQPAPLELAAETIQDVEGTVIYRAAADSRSLELTVSSGACSDSMSGEYFAYSARLLLDGQSMQGCARLGEQGSLAEGEPPPRQ